VRTLPILAGALSLAACATMRAPSTAQLDRVQARYDQVKAFADLLLPYLPEHRAARVRLAGRVADRALLAARVATTIAEQRAALARAEAAIGGVDDAIDRP
jgi:trans-aconitate methyltransferase